MGATRIRRTDMASAMYLSCEKDRSEGKPACDVCHHCTEYRDNLLREYKKAVVRAEAVAANRLRSVVGPVKPDKGGENGSR